MAKEKTMSTTDPLQLLPSEIVLRILEFSPTSSLANLTRLNRSWNSFIDRTHQEAIYSTPDRTPHPSDGPSKDFLHLQNTSTSFSRYYSNATTWKDLCKRHTLLMHNWSLPTPTTRESTIRVGNDPVWRFRPDFARRFIVSTSHAGGLNVTDMDSGRVLWRLDAERVRPFAHLEYQDGVAVWDREGNGLEVWRTGEEGDERGVFRRVKVLEHERVTRGFQLSFGVLCVVSNEGVGYVYGGMLGDDPVLERRIEIEDGAVGHLDQCEDVVVYSMGNEGYHFFEKATGKNLGTLDPQVAGEVYQIDHPEAKFRRGPGLGNLTDQGRRASACPPQQPTKDRTVPLEVQRGEKIKDDKIELWEDEWGAGMLRGNLFVGVSRGGRLVICSNWRENLAAKGHEKTNTVMLVECDTDGSNFDLGGWLSVHDHRVMFEIQDLIYVVGLTDDDRIYETDLSRASLRKDLDSGRALPGDFASLRPSFATATSITAQLAVPVSFMGIYDDCIMTTYTTLHYRRRPDEGAAGPLRAWNRVLPTKAIRILSLAPNVNGADDGDELEQDVQLPNLDATQGDLYQLIAMLAGDPEDDEEGDEDIVTAENGPSNDGQDEADGEAYH